LKTKDITLVGALSAIALTIFIAEAQLPPIVPLPGVKLGLANVITLVAMCILGRREAALVLLIRVVLGSLFAGNVSPFLFSACGGALAYAVMALTVGLFPERLLWAVSVLAALAHNAGQLAAAVVVTGTPSILIYAPALVAAGIATGVFTGVAAMFLARALKKMRAKS
jgi:heptaprenyl diphosphate synthase